MVVLDDEFALLCCQLRRRFQQSREVAPRLIILQRLRKLAEF